MREICLCGGLQPLSHQNIVPTVTPTAKQTAGMYHDDYCQSTIPAVMDVKATLVKNDIKVSPFLSVT